MGIQSLSKILLIGSLTGCSTVGSIKIYALDPEIGLVRDSGDEILNLDQVTCTRDIAQNKQCPFAALSWDDLRTLIEEAK